MYPLFKTKIFAFIMIPEVVKDGCRHTALQGSRFDPVTAAQTA